MIQRHFGWITNTAFIRPRSSSTGCIRRSLRIAAPASSATGIQLRQAAKTPTINKRDYLRLGRAKRDAMLPIFGTVKEFSEAKFEGFIDGKGTVFEGIGPATLAKFHMRARLLSTKDAMPFCAPGAVSGLRPRTVFRHRSRSHAGHLLPARIR